MATNYFLGDYWGRENLEALRLSLQQARLTGQVIRIKTGPGQETEFNPKETNLDLLLEQVQFAISELEDATDDPADAAPNRAGITRANFCA